MSKKRSLYLISPALKYPHMWNLREFARLMGKKIFSFPLALPTVAALTPENYDIRIIDEQLEAVPFGDKPDIVGITTMIPTSHRAYEIADRFRANGVPVVMGGSHATYAIEECLGHADAVVAGEAEIAWEQCLHDFEKKKMGKLYRNEDTVEFTKAPPPRWDLVDTDSALVLGVQVSRGCPYRCEFCLVSKMFGHVMRYRDLDDVVAEIARLPKKQLFFVDDNFTVNKQFTRRLMERLKGLNVSWSCQASVDVADDESLLKAMAEAGCTGMLVGFESVNPAALAETHKDHNKMRSYERIATRVQTAGIELFGSFIAGFDSDTMDVFDHILSFADANNITNVLLSSLSVLNGSPLHERMAAEGRLTTPQPELINGAFPCMQYLNMSQLELITGYFATLSRLYSPDVLWKKAMAVFSKGAYTRKFKGDISPLEKFRLVLTVMRIYLLTTDAQKRALFLDLVGLAIAGKVYIGKVFEYLTFVAGFRQYIDGWERNKDEVLALIKQNDRGPLVPGRKVV